MFPQRPDVWSAVVLLDAPALRSPPVAGKARSSDGIGYPVSGSVRCRPVYRRATTTLTIIAGFLLGLFLARIDHIVSPIQGAGPVKTIAVAVDWTAPPLAGGLVAAAFFVAQRYKRLHEAERAASRVLAERLAGTERRQAIWVVAAAIAHDLKNPLHNMQLLLEEASEETDPARRSELLARLRDNTDRAAARLSDLARAGRAPDEVERFVDVSVILEDLLGRLASAARESGAQVVIDCPRGLLVRADPLALSSAIENVAANALDSLRKVRGGRLTITARHAGELVQLTVEDDGPGIPPELRERLFTPFSSGGSGTGLGLTIARALARAGGGELVCVAAEPRYTVFRFTFPGRSGRLTVAANGERIAS
jgi:signal transduction histidine kinase